MNQIKIFIVDDDPFWTKKLSTFLNNEPDFLVVGIAQSQKDAEEFLMSKQKFDVVLMDIRWKN
jgi:NarL family two-component system response regulator LiaR